MYCDPLDRGPIEERATARVLYAILNHATLHSSLLADALMFTEYSIKFAIRQWFRGRTSEAEQKADLHDLILSVPDMIEPESALAYRVTMDLLQEVCQDVPAEDDDWGERWLEVLSPDELNNLAELHSESNGAGTVHCGRSGVGTWAGAHRRVHDLHRDHEPGIVDELASARQRVPQDIAPQPPPSADR